MNQNGTPHRAGLIPRSGGQPSNWMSLMAPEPFMDMAELAGLDAGIRDTPESTDGASGAESGLADPMIEVRLPTSPAHSRQKAPRVGLEKVPDTGGQRTLLCCWTTRFFCPMPQDICLRQCTRPLICPANARARPCSQRDRLHRHIHRHGWRSRDVERRFPEPTSPRRYVLPAPLFSTELPTGAQPHPPTASRPIHSPAPSHPGCAARRCSCQMC